MLLFGTWHHWKWIYVHLMTIAQHQHERSSFMTICCCERDTFKKWKANNAWSTTSAQQREVTWLILKCKKKRGFGYVSDQTLTNLERIPWNLNFCKINSDCHDTRVEGKQLGYKWNCANSLEIEILPFHRSSLLDQKYKDTLMSSQSCDSNLPFRIICSLS